MKSSSKNGEKMDECDLNIKEDDVKNKDDQRKKDHLKMKMT